ncbi:MAG: hypothetical protein ABI895_21155 [Deltaproteobacteria bacterium]
MRNVRQGILSRAAVRNARMDETAPRARRPWTWHAVAVAVALLVRPALARPQSEPPASVPSSVGQGEARQLFKDGNALFDAGWYEDALSKFQVAYAAWANPKILLNLATTLRVLDRNVEALQAYQRYSSEAHPSPERKAEVDAICSELLGRVATLQLGLAPGTQSATLDGKVLDVTGPTTLYVEPGEHVLASVSAAGEQALRFTVEPGEARELAAPSAPPAPDRVSELPPAVPAEPAPRGHHFALLARADFDGRGRGVLGAAGLGYTLGANWQVAVGALLGAHSGAWVGLERFVGNGPLQLSVGLSAPTFFAGSAHVGASLDAGARWAVLSDVSLRGRAAVVHFPSVPDGYSQTVFVPSLGLEWRP